MAAPPSPRDPHLRHGPHVCRITAPCLVAGQIVWRVLDVWEPAEDAAHDGVQASRLRDAATAVRTLGFGGLELVPQVATDHREVLHACPSLLGALTIAACIQRGEADSITGKAMGECAVHLMAEGWAVRLAPHGEEVDGG